MLHRALLLAVLSLPALAAVPAQAARPSLPATPAAAESRIRSSDIIYSDRALSGAPVVLLEHPRRHAAGVAVPAGVATLYSPKGANQGGESPRGSDGSQQTDNSGKSDPGKDKDGNVADNNNGGGNNGNSNSNGNGNGNGSRPPLDQELVQNHEFAQGLAHWESENAYVTTSFGPIRASNASQDGIFAVAHTGLGHPNNLGFIQQSIPVHMGRNAAFSMLYNFVSTEFPVWWGSQYNDYFSVTLVGPSGEKTLTMGEFLNSTSFSLVSGLPEDVIEGWDPGIGGQTGWKMFTQGSLPLKAGIYKLRIDVHDVGDNIVDSAILVDRVSLR